MHDQYRGIRENVPTGRPVTNVETHRMRKDGEIMAVSVSTAPLHDVSGQLSGIVVVYGDIRERKELEAQLRQAQKMEAVGQLAGGVAHDFNNLLTVIRTASEMLLADLKPGDTRRVDIEDIEEAATRAATLTRQLLAFSRQQVLEPRVVDLNQVVSDLEPMARRLVQENIAVEIASRAGSTADHGRPSSARPGDPQPGGQRARRDARRRHDRDRDRRRGAGSDFPRTHPSARPGPHVMLRVTDTGCGMDGATRARIFEPFFTTKPVGVGTGLGLATVYGIVKQSGGHIWVDSEVGRGSSFTIHLPVSAVTEDEAKPAQPKQPVARRAHVLTPGSSW